MSPHCTLLPPVGVAYTRWQNTPSTYIYIDISISYISPGGGGGGTWWLQPKQGFHGEGVIQKEGRGEGGGGGGGTHIFEKLFK